MSWRDCWKRVFPTLAIAAWCGVCWAGMGSRSSCLKRAGDEFGITRERASRSTIWRWRGSGPRMLSPVLEEVLAFVRRAVNRDAQEVVEEMQRRGFTRIVISRSSPYSRPLGSFGRVPGFTVETSRPAVVCRRGTRRCPVASLRRPASPTAKRGVQNVSALCLAISTDSPPPERPRVGQTSVEDTPGYPLAGCLRRNILAGRCSPQSNGSVSKESNFTTPVP